MSKLVYKSLFVMLIFSPMLVAVVCPLLVCFGLFVLLDTATTSAKLNRLRDIIEYIRSPPVMSFLI